MHDQTDHDRSIDPQDAESEATQAEAEPLSLVDRPAEDAEAPIVEPEAGPPDGVTIEEMPAAPDADEAARDADAPAWAPATEGHTAMPAHTSSAASSSAEDGSEADSPAPAAAPAPAPGVRISGDRVEVRQTGAERIEGHEVSIVQGGAAIIRGDKVRVEQGGAFAIVGRRIDLRDSGAFILLARRTSGQVNVAFDWRAIAAVVTGIIAIMVVRGRR